MAFLVAHGREETFKALSLASEIFGVIFYQIVFMRIIMAGIGYSVCKSIDDFLIGDLNGAMLHACMAVDGTSKKTHFEMYRHRTRFITTLRENYSILRPMSFPGLDIEQIKWPVKISAEQKPEEWPDTAEVIYGVHRCAHGHGDELPAGFELMPDVLHGDTNSTSLIAAPGRVQISDRVIFGLLAIAVLAPVNHNLNTKDGYWLSLNHKQFIINEWWGKRDEFLAIAAPHDTQRVNLDLGNWYSQVKSETQL
ncbi:hypothetical protein [Pantoea anthophila]|uniref:hypothetical protein n=1 Tax=Pantoea anthophila TaxID=470931 RepID=UPI00277D9466|nr:hypothetical protein [Pantoea anthophila]MDQ1214014.1 hypothetical protein [Pantoea anthophila]